MLPEKKNYWFPAKRYGWGWGPPCAWQGWVVMLLFILIGVGGSIVVTLIVPPEQVPLLEIGFATFLILFLMGICWAKGEPPRWRWGDRDRQSPESVAERLAHLKELHQQNLISEAEYEAKRKEILKEL
jgi:hypothetical protein